jgi:nucleotide-binding universal stress UspA family protein
MIGKFLIAVDGSQESRVSLEFGLQLALQAGATVILITVTDENSLFPASIREVPGPGPLTQPVDDYLRQAAESILEEAGSFCAEKGIQFTTVIRSGEPAEEILKEAEESKADLIVVGSRGKSSLEAILMGSVTSGVIHQEPKFPVLVVRS